MRCQTILKYRKINLSNKKKKKGKEAIVEKEKRICLDVFIKQNKILTVELFKYSLMI